MTGGSPSTNFPLSHRLSKSDEEIRAAFQTLSSTRDVANLLEIKESQLTYILWRKPPEKRYRTWRVKKRQGGYREIDAPTKSHKILQRKFGYILGIVGRVRPSAYGFVVGKGIVANASQHIKQRIVLNLDLKDFFPSINFGRVRGLFMAKPYSLGDNAATAIAQLCCYNGRLPQGSPASPMISNLICARLDAELTRLAKKFACRYTRYADDITFSTSRNHLPDEIAIYSENGANVELGELLKKTIAGNGFAIHEGKVRLQLRSQRQEVTGLIVNRRPNVSRRFTAQIRAMLHAWEKFGYEKAEAEHLASWDKKHRPKRPAEKLFERAVRGKLAFLEHVRGDTDGRYVQLRRWLARLTNEIVVIDEPKGAGQVFDVFICHASEDKVKVVHPLLQAFEQAGIKVWVDENQASWGDSLTSAINNGLAASRFVVIVLSESFLKKKWPAKEMNAVMAKEIKTGIKRALPLIVGGKHASEAVLETYPLLEDKLYLTWSPGDIGNIVSTLKALLAT